MRKDKERIVVFELGAFNPKTGVAYLVEDGIHTLQYLVQVGRRHKWRGISKREARDWWTRQLKVRDRMVESFVDNADWIIIGFKKFNPDRLEKLFKELSKLNREVEK